MLTAILFVVMLLILTIPHEFGHMIVAKLCDVNVEEFSIGIGPMLWHRRHGDTTYSLRLLPFGGYCKMEGELGKDDNNPRSFINKTYAEKFAIMSAGVMMNVLIAWLIITGIFAYYGVASNKISEVPKSGPAYEAGIRAGDRIVSIDGNECKNWSDVVTDIASADKGDILEIEVARGSETHTYYVKTEYNKKQQSCVIGVVSKRSRNPIDVIRNGTAATVSMNNLILNSFKQLLTGHVSSDSVSGPVGLVKVVNQVKSYGAMNFLLFLAMVSLNLAIFNLLPIPSLDGAKLLFLIARAISGGRITDEMEAYVNVFGVMLMFMILILVTFNDIMNLF